MVVELEDVESALTGRGEELTIELTVDHAIIEYE